MIKKLVKLVVVRDWNYKNDRNFHDIHYLVLKDDWFWY